MGADAWLDVAIDEVVRRGDKAALVVVSETGHAHWLPYCHCDLRDAERGIVWMSDWLYNREIYPDVHRRIMTGAETKKEA